MGERKSILKKQSMLQSLRCNWQKQQRSKKQLVVIAVEEHKVVISCWQADCCLLQKEKVLEQPWLDGCESWWQELEEVLKDVFIWARVPDMVDTLFLLDKVLVFGEELRLPQMEEQDMYQAIQWEAEQLVPWPKGSYNIAFAAHGTGMEEEIVQLWAWPKEQARLAGELLYGLRLHLQGILVGLTAEKVQQAWYKGAHFKNWSLVSERQHWEQSVAHVANSRHPQSICLGCLLLAALLYATAWGGCYMAQHQLDETEQGLAQYQLWQQRYDDNQRLEGSLQKYQLLAKQLQSESSHVGTSISRIGQQVGMGCWLDVLSGGSEGASREGSGKGMKQASSSLWQVEGACYSQGDLERFVERLETSRHFTQVQLQHSQQGLAKLKFALTVREK